MSPVALAFIGDGVFELMVRERLLKDGSMPANRLHVLAVKKVSATAQSAAYEALESVLNETEQGILKRGRNANTSKIPKSCTPEQYRKATAIEALFGYVYLSGDVERLNELYEVMDNVLTRQE